MGDRSVLRGRCHSAWPLSIWVQAMPKKKRTGVVGRCSLPPGYEHYRPPGWVPWAKPIFNQMAGHGHPGYDMMGGPGMMMPKEDDDEQQEDESEEEVSSSSSSTGKAKSSTKNKTLDWLVIGDDWWWRWMMTLNENEGLLLGLQGGNKNRLTHNVFQITPINIHNSGPSESLTFQPSQVA